MTSAQNLRWNIPPFNGVNFPIESAYLTKGASVLWADYERLQDDFGFDNLINRDVVDSWLISNAAILSSRQRSTNCVNDAVDCHPQAIRALRPPHYGRSLIIPVPHIGADFQACIDSLDIKGCGVAPDREPERRFTGSGLLGMPEAFRELIAQRVVERAFRRMNISIRGLPIYAILSLGFEGRSHNGSRLDATIIVRKAHRRPRNGSGYPQFDSAEHRVTLLTEIALRMAGLTSACDMTEMRFWRTSGKAIRCQYGQNKERELPSEIGFDDIAGKDWSNLTFDIPNIQMTDQFSEHPLIAELVDFGHYQICQDNVAAVATPVDDRLFRWGAHGGPAWGDDLGADSKFCIDRDALQHRPAPPEICRWERIDPTKSWSGFYRFGLETSHAIACQGMTPAQVDKHINDFVNLVAPLE